VDLGLLNTSDKLAMTKVCTKCKQELPIEAFGTFKKVPHGFNLCKVCKNAEHAAWRKTEAGKASDKRYNDSPEHRAAVARYQETEAGKAAARKAVINMRKTPGWKAIVARYKQTDKYRAKVIRDNHKPNSKEIQQRHYRKKRLEQGAKLCDAMKAGIYLALKSKKNGRKWESLVGYTLEELMAHLEKQFQPGMTWENYGEWHLDHIHPRAAHFYTDSTDPDFQRCWALDNLQPLWAKDNKLKSAKITQPFQPTLDLMFKSTQALDRIG
jgi:hypothetical protein